MIVFSQNDQIFGMPDIRNSIISTSLLEHVELSEYAFLCSMHPASKCPAFPVLPALNIF